MATLRQIPQSELVDAIDALALQWKAEEHLEKRRLIAIQLLRMLSRELGTAVYNALKRNPTATGKDLPEEVNQHAYISVVYLCLKSFNPVLNTSFYLYCRDTLSRELDDYLTKRIEGRPYPTYGPDFDCAEILLPNGSLPEDKDSTFMLMVFNACSEFQAKALSGSLKGLAMSEVARLTSHDRKIVDNSLQDTKRKGAAMLFNNHSLFGLFGDSTQ